MNDIDLKNRVAIVTGGAQGFGYAMVDRFSKSDAKVIIYDELGRKVGQEHNQKLYFGTNAIELNIKDYKSGIYFVSLTFDNKSITKQIIKK